MSAFNRPGGLRGPAGSTLDDIVARLEDVAAAIAGQSGGLYDRRIVEALEAMHLVMGSKSDCVTGDSVMAALCRLNNMLGVVKSPSDITPPLHCPGFEAAQWARGTGWIRCENANYHPRRWTMQLPNLADAPMIQTDRLVTYGTLDQVVYGPAFGLNAPTGTELRVCIVARHKVTEAPITVVAQQGGPPTVVTTITDGSVSSGSCDDLLMITGPTYAIEIILPAEGAQLAPTADVWFGYNVSGAPGNALGASMNIGGCCR